MRRLPLLAAVLVWCALPAQAQEQPARQPLETWGAKKAPAQAEPAAPQPQPASTDAAEPVPLSRLRGYDPYADEALGVPTDTLTEAQILRRISRIYAYQADLLVAQANDDVEHAERLLELAMTDLATLADQPDIMDRPRFRELYRTVVVEYERFYGVTSPELAMPFGDIFALRADIFAILDEVDQPLLEDVTLPVLAPMETAVPMTVNRVVERTMQYFLREKRDVLERWMARADTYFPMIEQIFAEEGVPDELKYLAMVESGLNPRARSWAKAVGMWQFIAATGRAYDLDVNSWVDERMDPEKSTRAAARHLRDLYEMYGNNWHVALAGYNCSPRCIKRAIRQAGGTMDNMPSYWDIYPYLPRETRGYVPQFIAFSLIMSNPEAFGLSRVQSGPRYAYDQVAVQGMLSLEDVAQMAGSDVATIRALNPELVRASLPPSQGAYPLRLPPGTYARFAAAFDALPEASRQPVGEHVVRRGDSLGKIATKYGVSVSALRQANGLRGSTIHPGQRLVVPVPAQRGAASLADAQPISVEYGARVVRPIEPERAAAVASGPAASPSPPVVQAEASRPTPAATPAASSTPRETRVTYTVRRGDSLSKIATKYGVSVHNIQQWNNLRGTRIRTGQRLVLYSAGAAASQPEYSIHRVRRGESLGKIATRYGTSVSRLKQWNDLRSNTIHPGQRLKIYANGSAPPSYVTHRVQRGESLGRIASKYGTSVSRLKQWNNLRGNTIHPGQRLKIYR